MIQFYKLKECIVNLSEIQVYPSGGREYVRDVWFPQIEKDGVKFVAFVVPESAFGETSMNKAHEKLREHKRLQSRDFKNEETAKMWIKEAQALSSTSTVN